MSFEVLKFSDQKGPKMNKKIFFPSFMKNQGIEVKQHKVIKLTYMILKDPKISPKWGPSGFCETFIW